MPPRMAAPDQQQPELPAWLETLRSGERPGGSSISPVPSNFSAEELDDGMLPSWMRPERSEMIDNSPSDIYPAQRPASTSAPNTDGGPFPRHGMSASSLIDEQALPSWLQEKRTPSAPESISASSLVQAEALPNWMKSMQPTYQQTPPAAAATPSLPYAQPAIPPQGIMGNDLIDQQNLPQWMSTQDSSASNSAQHGLAASSLLDMNALPPWLRDANQGQKAGAMPPSSFQATPASAEPAASMPNAPVPQPPGQMSYGQPSLGQTPNMNSNLSAASFIDMNALPDWLRPAEEQRQPAGSSPVQQGGTEGQRQAPFGAPTRPDNVRVPSRPRGEVVAHEESEVAANVFASMLGVASASPAAPYAGQQTRDGQGRPQASLPSPQQQNLSQPTMNSGAAFPGYGFPASANSSPASTSTATPGMPQGFAGMPSTPNNGQVPGGFQGAYSVGGAMPGNLQPPQQQSGQGYGSGMPPARAMNTTNDQPKANTKPAKRGFLSTILDWFQISR